MARRAPGRVGSIAPLSRRGTCDRLLRKSLVCGPAGKLGVPLPGREAGGYLVACPRRTMGGNDGRLHICSSRRPPCSGCGGSRIRPRRGIPDRASLRRSLGSRGVGRSARRSPDAPADRQLGGSGHTRPRRARHPRPRRILGIRVAVRCLPLGYVGARRWHGAQRVRELRLVEPLGAVPHGTDGAPAGAALSRGRAKGPSVGFSVKPAPGRAPQRSRPMRTS